MCAVIIGITACRDVKTELTTAPAPSAASRSIGIDDAANASWSTYSAVVTLQSGDPGLFGSIGARDAKFRMTRSLRSDGSWAMTIRPIADSTPRGLGEGTIGFSRIELTDSEVLTYDKLGQRITRLTPDIRKGTDFAYRARIARAKRPGMFPDVPSAPPAQTSRGVRSPSGSAGLDMLIAGPKAGARARLRLARAFADAPERVGPALRFTRAEGDHTLEVTVDSLTGVPLELKEVRGSEVALRVTHSYDLLQNGIRVLRETRVERAASGDRVARTFVTRYDSVTVGQTSEALQ